MPDYALVQSTEILSTFNYLEKTNFPNFMI